MSATDSATSSTPPLMRWDAMPCSPSSLRTGEDGGTYLTFRPQGYANPIELPVITSGSRDKTGAWTWNGSLEKPTLRPSVKSWHPDGTISHLWLNDGMCEYLSDSTDGLAGLSLPLFLLENVKEHATLSAGARVDHRVEAESTSEHENRAADRGCCVSSCSPVFLIDETPPPENVRAIFWIEKPEHWAFGKMINGRIVTPNTPGVPIYWSPLPEVPREPSPKTV